MMIIKTGIDKMMVRLDKRRFSFPLTFQIIATKSSKMTITKVNLQDNL